MRLLFFILLLANAAAYHFIRFAESRAGAENQIMLLQIAPEKMKLLKPGTLASRAQANAVCLEWSGIPLEDSARARVALENAGLRDKILQREVGDRYWVYVPLLKAQADADKKIADLKARGIADFAIVQDSAQSRAIALGDFPTAEAANAYLLQLREKGLRTAAAGMRSARAASFVIRDPGAAMAAKIAEMKADFPAAQLKVTSCDEALTVKANRSQG